ncbi:LysR family transcriptional regulator [Rheinheimera sp. F8]|uniref:LysR family transcriptional regulator n=1 Tax=Rheinheimera sp. F8 TaxID=1763998 RepID=UPI0007448FE6|nr:LysR family transcriptional regulator [Rheinheimera sp. F8]ALZ74557.1 LysR family transcriptional regulator [Rheinheimera sp. F8]
MNAQTQFKLSALDLEIVLTLVRCGTLANAGERLGVDASTVFRSLQRIERGIGQMLFTRSRAGYQASELALAMAGHAEQLETALESARSAAQIRSDDVSGNVRITTTDTILHGLVAPALQTLRASHPLLRFELHTGNALASLTQRDADIAIRATTRPPQHLIGKQIGPIRVALFGSKNGTVRSYADVQSGKAVWIAPDDALPDHPSVLWRKRHFPKVQPTYRVNSILTVMELINQGLGIGVVPLFLAKKQPELLQLTEVLDECQTELWLLTHAESRHLRRISAVYGYLAQTLTLS